MSLSSALGTVASGLATLQAQTAILSGNIANAQNPDYSRKQAMLTTRVVNGLPQAASITAISRVTAPDIAQEFLAALAGLGLASGQVAQSEKLAEMFGASDSSGAQSPLLAALSEFEAAWKDLEATPETASLRSQVVARGTELVQAIQKLAGQQQALQSAAQQSIEQGLATVNDAAGRIAQLNSQIVAQQAAGQSSADLEDLRDAEVAKLAGQIDVRVRLDETGAMSVYSATGVQIVGIAAERFSYDRSSNSIIAAGSGKAVNAGLGGGALQAQLDFLDTSAAALASSDPNRGGLAKAMNQLDALAGNLMDVVNAAYDDPATATVEAFFTLDPDAPAGTSTALALRVAVAADSLDADRAGAVQQAMRNSQIDAASSNPATAPNGLQLGSTTLFGLASGIAAYHARSLSDNQANAATAESVKSLYEVKLQNAKGVDIDTELAQLQVLQNNYAALASLMNSITTMFDELMSIGR